MEVKIKKLDPQAVIPKYAIEGDAGLDLTAISKNWDNKSQTVEYGTGLAIEIPEGFVGLIFPRSSIKNQDLSLSNSVGVLDSNYRGEIKAYFRETAIISRHSYEVGDRIAQLLILPYPEINFIETDELSNTDRGEKGFGSTGT